MALGPYLQTEPCLVTPVLPNAVDEALLEGRMVLTANQRAAHTLRQAFDRAALDRGHTLWASPPILSLDSWLGVQWRKLLLAGEEDRLLLNRSQQHLLWRSILAADEEVTGLQSLDTLATLAADGWQRLHDYSGSLSQLRQAAISPDTKAFARWAIEFERRSNRRRYLTASELPSALTAALAQGVMDLPAAGLALVDFTQLVAACANLFDSIERAGYEVARIATGFRQVVGELHTAEDDAGEIKAAAQWLRRTSYELPTARLALVVPNLGDRRAEIDRALLDSLTGALSNASSAPDFEFSLGQPLSETAVCACALTLLRWALGPLPISAISNLLLSPFLGAANAETASAAAEFDAFELRRADMLQPVLSLDGCIQMIARSKRRPRLTLLHKRLTGAARHRCDSTQAKSYADWADEFRSLLSTAGWTDTTQRDTISSQIHKSWESALDELATLDFENTNVTATAALDALAQITGQTIFAPESTEAAIQVVGPLELGGKPFDALWFLGADDVAWPPTIPPHPLLPWTLQHALQMPGTNAEGEAATARALTRTIAHSGERVVFSYAKNGEDQLRRPSAVIAELGLEPFILESTQPGTVLAFEHVTDAGSLPPLPDRVLRGGARVLQLQAACAFRAFAEMRLVAVEPEAPEPGFDARYSGTIVHLVMQYFWDAALSQEKLRGMTLEARNTLLRKSIDTALERPEHGAQTRWDRAYLNVQRRRLFDLLAPWLVVELARQPFSVRARERAVEDIAIGPLRLKLRVDRIDDTPAGPLIIDYKTGRASYKGWFGDRPDEPQLPLYGVLTEGERLGGIAFAILRAGREMGLQGVAENPGVLRSKPMEEVSMPAQVERWADVLSALAQAFADGHTEVLPKDYPNTCQHCAQRLLCRLDVSTLSQDEHEPDDPESIGEPFHG